MTVIQLLQLFQTLTKYVPNRDIKFSNNIVLRIHFDASLSCSNNSRIHDLCIFMIIVFLQYVYIASIKRYINVTQIVHVQRDVSVSGTHF